MLRSLLLAPARWLTTKPWARPFIDRVKAAMGTERAADWAKTLRPRLPVSLRWHLDAVHTVPGEGVFFIGWMLDPEQALARFDVVADDGSVHSISERWVRCERPDVLAAYPSESRTDVLVGFIAFVPMARVGSKIAVRATARGGATELRDFPTVVPTSVLEWSKVVLSHVSMKHPDLARIVAMHVGPALRGLAKRREAPPEVVVKTFGTPVACPEATLLIPLYGRFDFIRYQMALFADDPSLRNVEIVYVVDDPRIIAPSMDLALHSYEFFRVPITVVASERNLGFAGANNLGARHARGTHLVLLNSDVMPGENGWLPKLLAPLADVSVGVVGARLLYEDGTVQHAGMRLEAYEPWGGMPILVHPGKGLPASAPTGRVAEMDAVTGACMAMRRDEYTALGGLDETYILGDFEDSDLCVRFRRRGKTTVMVDDVTLFHLERQSQWLMPDLEWRHKISLVNCWQHAQVLKGGRS